MTGVGRFGSFLLCLILMFVTLGYFVAFLLVLLALSDWISMLAFRRVAKRGSGTADQTAFGQPSGHDQDWPTVAVLMGLKGADPNLADGLRRLFQQNYPCYDVHIVVDQRSDPAWQVVQQAVHEVGASHVHVDVYRPSHRTGPVNSTNSKQMQALQALDDSVDVVAMADGDLVAHPDWLRELVAPLRNDPRMAATFGNRWFQPQEGHLGSLVRYLWNVGAVISMYLLTMPWGGCFAIRMNVIRQLNLVEKWSRQIAFDASVPGDLRRAGLGIQFIPRLLMENDEECRLRFCHNFFQRQLTWTRLYHERWTVIAGYAFLSGAAWILAITLILMAISLGNVIVAAAFGAAGTFYWLTQWCIVLAMQKSAERIMAVRQRHDWLTTGRGLQLLVLLPLTQAIQFASVVAAMVCRRVRWRGILLEVRSGTDIRMIASQHEPLPPRTLSPRESL